jgi:hypothetical protein
MSADDSLQSQVTTLLAENSKQERVIAENVAKNENLSKELLSVNRELTNLQTMIQSKDTTISELNEIIKEFESVSSAKDARLHQFEEQLETHNQENLELKSKHSVLTEDLLRKTELIEKRDEMINQANKALEIEKKQVIELITKLEEAETNNKNAVNANLALQDLIQDRSFIDEKMVKNNTELYDLLKKVAIAKANDNDKKLNTNNQLASILKQCLALIPSETEQTELDAVLGAVDLNSYEISIREHLLLVETPTQASIVDNNAPKGSSLHTLTAASLDDTMDDFSVKVKSDAMDIEETCVEVVKITEYHSNSDTDSEDDNKWDKLMMMTTQMPQEDVESSHDSVENEYVKGKDESINANESQLPEESLKGSLLDVGFSNDSLNNNKEEEEKMELNMNTEDAPTTEEVVPTTEEVAPTTEEVAPTTSNSQNSQLQLTTVISEIVVAVDETDKQDIEIQSPSPSKRSAEVHDSNVGSSEKKKAKFSHDVTIINNADENDNFNMNINMSYHCESTCASLVDN